MSEGPSRDRPRPGQRFRRLRNAGAPRAASAQQEGDDTSASAAADAQSAWRQKLSRLAYALLASTFGFRSKLSALLRLGARFAISAIAASLALPLIAPSAEVRLANFGHTIEFSLGAAGLIGTVLVLTFTLSMIPVQRAAEGMPVSVVRLLARDWVNAFLFVALALLCLSSFSLALYAGFGLRPQIVLPMQLLLIGITFDLVRWHYRHT